MKDNKASAIQKNIKSVDWDKAHQSIDAFRIVLEEGLKPSAATREKVLRERARSLAGEPAKGAEAGSHIEVVAFLLSHEIYAVESKYVREVYPLNELTPIPSTPRFVLGIMNVRGQVLSVIDIKRFFDLPEKGLTDLNKVIILHSGEMEFGIVADAIIGVKNILSGDLKPPLPTLTGIREEYLKGITKEREVVLDAGKLLSDKGIVVGEKSDSE